MKVLVTGAAGFIGQHLTAALANADHHVTPTDRTGTDFPRVDLLDPGAFADLLDLYQPDLVVHLAAQVGRLFGEDDIRNSVRSNTEMTAVVASECGRRGIRLAYASSSEVYGDRGDAICWENSPLYVLPHNVYGLTKRQGEEFCRLYTHDPFLLRFSMPYGPGAPPGRGRRALDTMLWQAYHRLPITVHDGAERSWCWIDDLTDAVVRVIENGQGGAWNIGRDDAPISMLKLAQICCNLCAADQADLIRVVHPPTRQTVIKRLSTSKLRALGWEPKIELAEGLVKMVDWIARFDKDGNPRVERQAA